MAPAFDLGRPDLIVAVNGRPMNAEQFQDFVRAAAPGERVTIEYRRSRNRGGQIPDELDHEDEIRTIEIVLVSRDEWTGTIGRDCSHGIRTSLEAPHLLDPFDAENVLGAAVAEHGLGEPIENVLGRWEQARAIEEDALKLIGCPDAT